MTSPTSPTPPTPPAPIEPTIRDVAAAAAVSRQTVSRVLNDPGSVSAETRRRVEAAIAELGYERDEAAAALGRRRAARPSGSAPRDAAAR